MNSFVDSRSESASAAHGRRVQGFQRSNVWRMILGVCWYLLHFMISVAHFMLQAVRVLRCYLISSGLLKRYRVLRLDKLRYLAIVFDNEDVKYLSKIINLLDWLQDIGVRNVILYDMEGVLKHSETALKKLTKSSLREYTDVEVKNPKLFVFQEKMSIELLCLSDGKEGAAKAASFLCLEHLKNDNLGGHKKELTLTESDMANALSAVGCGGPEPELLLVFGPARCHLGFPAWRMRYTEIVHMGQLKSLQYGAIVKVIYDFSKKQQNYGS